MVSPLFLSWHLQGCDSWFVAHKRKESNSVLVSLYYIRNYLKTLWFKPAAIFFISQFFILAVWVELSFSFLLVAFPLAAQVIWINHNPHRQTKGRELKWPVGAYAVPTPQILLKKHVLPRCRVCSWWPAFQYHPVTDECRGIKVSAQLGTLWRTDCSRSIAPCSEVQALPLSASCFLFLPKVLVLRVLLNKHALC